MNRITAILIHARLVAFHERMNERRFVAYTTLVEEFVEGMKKKKN